MHPMLNIAVKAARRAGSIIMRASDNLDALTIQHKSLNDLVSEVDRAAEDAIIDILHTAYPDHAILAEETGASGDSEFVWIIDPLDGTTNFLHGFPVYCVSIALSHRGVLSHGVIYDPVRNDLFTASRGRGAFLNDRRLRVSKRERLIDGLIGTGFPFRMFDHADPYVGMMRDFMQKTAGIRRPGAAALDLANVAAGRLDGFWEIGLHPLGHGGRRADGPGSRRTRGRPRRQHGLPRERPHRRRIAPDLRADDQRHRAAPDTRTAHRTAEAGVGSGLNR